MVGSKEASAQKRKASPSPPADDGGSKRPKIEVKQEHHDGAIGDAGNGHVEDHPNGSGSAVVANTREEPAESKPPISPEGEPGRAGAGRRSESNTPGSGRVEEGEKAARLSAEAGRRAPPVPSRRNFSQEEKKRGKRLFGGLLSTLSQTTSNSQQKKRLEIERRQQDRVHQQRAEDERRRAEKVAKLTHVRKIEQVEFDEQVMHTRHSNILALAHNLRTRCEPRLYYRPWELTKDQERIIEDQVRAAKETIEREEEEFQDQKVRRLRDLGALRPSSRQQNTVGEPKPLEDTNRRTSASSASKMHLDKFHDENGDEMVHEEEDTVLY